MVLTVDCDGSGSVSLPLVGEVNAAGKTVQEFRTELEARLADGYLTDPRVSAEVLNYRPFYILGEVDHRAYSLPAFTVVDDSNFHKLDSDSLRLLRNDKL